MNIAEKLLEIKAVTLSPADPYTWSSGIKSPIYCDNRVTLGYPLIRQGICRALSELILQHAGGVEVVAGTATAGIPHAAFIAERLQLPLSYVRSKSKAHGRGNQIEGADCAGKRVVVIEDLISTGGSSLNAVSVLRECGAEVLGVFAIFTYGLPQAVENFAAAGVPCHSLSNYGELILAAQRAGYVSEGDMRTLRAWHDELSARR